MKPTRRHFLHLVAGGATLPAVSRIARALDYPTRPIRLIVPGAPGGTVDIVGRLIGQGLSERLLQPFIIDNRPGAGINIGTDAAVRAPADGYTLVMVGAPNAINATLYQKLKFNFIRDITPVASMAHTTFAMEVNPSFPAHTVPEFISYTKANPGKINYGSAGIGTAQHLAGELFKMMTDVNMVHVPYRGEPQALTDLIGGQVQVMFENLTGSIEYVRTGKLRALAVTTATRSKELPDLPTVNDFVPGFETSGWVGIGAPTGTPSELIDRLNKEINAAIADPKMISQFRNLGLTVFASSPTEFGKFIAAETEKWTKVVKFSGAKAD
jgi:tripartite-type tricarboxylate transporter receptor subunit TctC